MILQHWKHHQEGFSLPSLCRAGPDLARKRDMCRDNIQPARGRDSMFRPPPCKQACNEPERLERVASIHPIHPSSLAKCVSNGYEHGTREVLPAANGGPAYSCLGRATECFQCVPVSTTVTRTDMRWSRRALVETWKFE